MKSRPASTDRDINKNHHVCPWWAGYLLASPIRRLFENPDKLLSPFVRPGQKALDIDRIFEQAAAAGFTRDGELVLRRSQAAVFCKPG